MSRPDWRARPDRPRREMQPQPATQMLVNSHEEAQAEPTALPHMRWHAHDYAADVNYAPPIAALLTRWRNAARTHPGACTARRRLLPGAASTGVLVAGMHVLRTPTPSAGKQEPRMPLFRDARPRPTDQTCTTSYALSRTAWALIALRR